MLRRGALLFPLLVLLAGASLIREAAVGVLADAETHWRGLLGRHATAPATKQVTLIEINDETLLKHVWPWAAADFAVFFHAALPMEPSGVAVEPVLDAYRGALAGEDRDKMYEKMLHDGILRAPKLVLGGQLAWAPESNAVAAIQPMPVIRNVTGDVTALPQFTHVDAWAEEQFRLSTKPGWTNMPDAPGVLGKCPLLFRYRGQPVPAITLQLAMDWAKVTHDEVTVVLGSHIALGNVRIPIDERGRMLVNFGAGFDRVEFDKLILSREQIEKGENPEMPAALFKGRVLILGRNDSAVRSLEIPGGRNAAASEVFASALSTIQTGSHIQRIGGWFDWALVGFVALATSWLPRSRASRLALAVLLGEAAYFTAAWFVFRSNLVVLPGVLAVGLALWVLVLRIVAKRVQRIIAF
jgi:CHASE2 domain